MSQEEKKDQEAETIHLLDLEEGQIRTTVAVVQVKIEREVVSLQDHILERVKDFFVILIYLFF